MKNVPLVVKRRDDQYTHTPLPTDGEVMSVYMFVYILLPNYLCVFRERRQKASVCQNSDYTELITHISLDLNWDY